MDPSQFPFVNAAKRRQKARDVADLAALERTRASLAAKGRAKGLKRGPIVCRACGAPAIQYRRLLSGQRVGWCGGHRAMVEASL